MKIAVVVRSVRRYPNSGSRLWVDMKFIPAIKTAQPEKPGAPI
ncbi:hypothetical protein [Caballeronia choica]|jgi:hypothetical protein|nr:hypothetical protein [Caballeronia choica]